MPNYAFETITGAEAAAFSSADNLSLSNGSAKATTILYLEDGTFSVTIAARTVIFGAYFPTLVPRLRFPDGSTLFVGTTGADTRDAGVVPSTGAMYGGDGADVLTTSPGDWFVQGNQGDDRIAVRTSGTNTIYGGQGNDNVTMVSGGNLPEGHQFVQGNKGNDTLQGSATSDTLLGGQGDDYIYGGGGGADFLNGNLGNDELQGSGQLFGEGGNDRLMVFGGVANTASGGDGDDYIQTGSDGTEGRNVVLGGTGNDTIGGHSTNRDLLDGGDGNDLITIITDSGSHVLPGATITGGSGADTIRASEGNDTINGGSGADVMSGGAGSDVFVLQDRPATNTPGDIDRILDWSVEDKIDLIGPISTYVEAGGSDLASALNLAKATLADGRVDLVVLQIPDGVAIFSTAFEIGNAGAVDTVALLVGRTLADISASNFV